MIYAIVSHNPDVPYTELCSSEKIARQVAEACAVAKNVEVGLYKLTDTAKPTGVVWSGSAQSKTKAKVKAKRKSTPRRRWTAEEDSFLKNRLSNGDKLSVAELSRALGRTNLAIKQRLTDLRQQH